MTCNQSQNLVIEKISVKLVRMWRNSKFSARLHHWNTEKVNEFIDFVYVENGVTTKGYLFKCDINELVSRFYSNLYTVVARASLSPNGVIFLVGLVDRW